MDVIYIVRYYCVKCSDVAAFGPSDEAGRAMGKTMCLIRA